MKTILLTLLSLLSLSASAAEPKWVVLTNIDNIMVSIDTANIKTVNKFVTFDIKLVDNNKPPSSNVKEMYLKTKIDCDKNLVTNISGIVYYYNGKKPLSTNEPEEWGYITPNSTIDVVKQRYCNK